MNFAYREPDGSLKANKLATYFYAFEKRNYFSKQMIRLTKDKIQEVKMSYERLYFDRQSIVKC